MIVARHQNQKSINKLVEEAEVSGELHLRNRKLKDVSLCFSEFNLSDVTIADLSHNSLNEIPLDIYQWHCIQNCNLSYNNIKQIPGFLTHFTFIEMLDLSNNLISHLPSSICDLQTLVVLLLQNNKIVSVPAAIGGLKHCEKLDISGNQLNNLPSEIGNMSSLKHLDVSKNCLFNLPDEIARLDLVYLNSSDNKIASIPHSFLDMKELENANFSDNPLTNPPLTILKKGRIHMFKLMQSQSAKSKRQQEIMEPILARKRDKILNKDYSLEEMVQNMQRHGLQERQEIPDTTEIKEIQEVQETNGISQNSPSNHSSPLKTPTEIEEETVISKNSIDSPVHENLSPKQEKLSPKHLPIKNNDTKCNSPKKAKERTKKAKQSVANHTAVDGPVNKNHNNKPLSPIKENSVSASKKPTDKKASSRAGGFPGYAPPPIKEKPKRRRISHLHGNNADQPHYLEIIKSRTAVNQVNRKVRSESDNDMSFTMRRKTEKIYEELEQLEDLRHSIESALKMPLPPDLLPSLSDGVVLCHLANHVKSRSIPTIHVPSPAVPKLPMPKARRNVDNFLDACSKLGIARSRLCSSTDLMQGKGLSRIVSTVSDLLKIINPNGPKREPSFSTPSVRIAPSLAQQK